MSKDVFVESRGEISEVHWSNFPFITDSLEEKDREEFSRMKVIKAAKLKSAQK